VKKKTDWDLISFVLASDVRREIITRLGESVQTPTNLKKVFNVPISRISSVLKELTEKGLVENLTPDRRKAKMYTLTELGKNVLHEIQIFYRSGGEKSGK
jgi:predicted transcriptional regulator